MAPIRNGCNSTSFEFWEDMNYTNGDALEPSVYKGVNDSMWMVFGSSKFSHTEGQKGMVSR